MEQDSMKAAYHPAYRPDIDGLRAIVVLFVVMFHAFPTVIRSGFIGVDIFFVISGYLISSIIFKSQDRNAFRFVDFYARRIRRIFPSLLIVLTTVLALGWGLLFQNEFKELGKHVFKSSIFTLNFTLMGENSYFETSAELKPLLHIWSLCIEEQFYVVWPVFTIIIWKLKPKYRFPVITVMTLVSFMANLIFVHDYPVITFYQPATRFWELWIGSLLAYMTLYQQGPTGNLRQFFPMVSEKTLNNVLSITGLCLILISGLLGNSSIEFPGWWALMPTSGAFLLIAAGQDAWLNRNMLSHPIAIFIGLISYPLYLWHWLLLSFGNIITGDALKPAWAIIAIVIAFILSFLTYKFVEQRIRFGRSPPYLPILLLLLLGGCAVAGQMIRKEIVTSRLVNDEVVKLGPDWDYEGSFNYAKKDGFQTFDLLGDPENAVMFIGDSHAEHYWSRLHT